MEHIVPLVANAMFIDHVRAPREDGVPVIRARDVVDVDALSDGLVPVMLSEELREFDLKISYSSGGVVAMQTPPPWTDQFDVYTLVVAVPQLSGLCRA